MSIQRKQRNSRPGVRSASGRRRASCVATRAASRRAIRLVVLGAALVGSGCAGRDADLRRAWEEASAAGATAPPPAATTAAASDGSASTESPSVIASLDDLLAVARRGSPRLAAAHARWQAALGRVPQMGTWPEPMGGYDLEVRDGERSHHLHVTQTVPLGKTGPARDAARAEVRAAAAEHAMTWWEVRARVAATWYELYRLARTRDALARHEELLGVWEQLARVRYAAGQLDYADLLRVQVEIAALVDERASNAETLEAARALLNAELDRAPDAPIDPPEKVPDPRGRDLLDELLATAGPTVATSPVVDARAQMTQAAEAGVRLARRGAWPELSFGVEYLEEDEVVATHGAVEDPGPVVYKVGASIPLWWTRTRGATEEARARVESARREHTWAQRTAESALVRTAAVYRDADRRVRFQETEQIPRIVQSVAVVEERFAAGRATLLELIDLERSWLDAELALARAEAERASAWVELEALVGRELGTAGGAR